MKCPKGQIWDAQLKGCRNITMADLTNQPKQTSGVNFPNPRNNVPAGTVFPNQSSGTNFPNYKPKTLTKEQQEAIDKANEYKKGGEKITFMSEEQIKAFLAAGGELKFI